MSALPPAVLKALARIPAIITERGYAVDHDLADELGISYTDTRKAIGILYHRHKVDRADGYLVPPPREPLPTPRQAA